MQNDNPARGEQPQANKQGNAQDGKGRDSGQVKGSSSSMTWGGDEHRKSSTPGSDSTMTWGDDGDTRKSSDTAGNGVAKPPQH
jgi:hypothetical protein